MGNITENVIKRCAHDKWLIQDNKQKTKEKYDLKIANNL